MTSIPTTPSTEQEKATTEHSDQGQTHPSAPSDLSATSSASTTSPAQPYGPHLILIGMMGAGKSTIGRALAKTLKRPLVDLDEYIVARCGVSINTIFDIEGEEGFRKRETDALTQLMSAYQDQPMVLATGGGVVVTPENHELLRRMGQIIYLRVPVDELYQRVASDSGRPLLATADPKATLDALLSKRGALYQSLAHYCVDGAQNDVRAVVNEIKRVMAQ